MTFSIMIPTRDRCADLEATCLQLLRLEPGPDEIILCTDGCLDNTVEMLRTRFPRFRVVQSERPAGSMVCRDRMLRVARGDIVLSLDDDSYPLQRDFFTRLESVFLEHPEAAVIVFPELRDGGEFSARDKTDSTPGHYVSAYANCAAAMRRTFYLERPGFPMFFTHMYEEPDYALQCYTAGEAVWFEPSITVRHRVSPVNRCPLQRHHSNARNELWSVWIRCPWPWLPLVSAYRIARQLVYAGSEGAGWLMREPCWWLAALKGWRQCRLSRSPVPWPAYYHWLRLARNPIYTFQEFRSRFSPPRKS
ncbi:MAG TPA: glycosyltransferase family A protein [Chthonomonadales bacterium]|nr:glycosyltransferase family A protein [Chthonomonadales bacterium]